MPYLLIRNKVADYSRWRPMFDEHGMVRKANGSKGARVFRSSSDSNDLIILCEWDDLNRARQFTDSDDLRQVMQKAGVSGKPDLYFLEELEKAPA